MARIAGVDLPKNKRVEIGLTYIYGIGRSTAREILSSLNIDFNTKTDQLSESEINNIRKMIDGRTQGGRGASKRDFHEHQAVDGSRMLSGAAPPQIASG